MTTNRSKISNKELRERVIELIKKTGKPVSIDFVAYNLGIGWGTARALLFKLMNEGVVIGIDTTKSWVFTLREEIRNG